MPQLSANFWAYVVLAVVLTIAAVTDVRSGKIYNWTTYPAVLIALVGHLLMGGLHGTDGALGLFGSLGGMAVGFIPMFAAWRAGGIGGGDAKIMGVVGALCGWRFVLTSMFYGFLIAAVMAIIVMLYKRITRDTLKRLFAFAFVLLVRAKPSDPATEQSPKIPIGLALCIGAGIALVLVCIYGPTEKMFLLGI